MTPAWWDSRLVGFDIESTSAEPETARIVTAALVAVGAGATAETLTLLANPGVEISEGAVAVHGITNERACADGLPASEVVAVVIDTLAIYLAAGAPLCCFCGRFDLTILDREARRYGLVPLQDRVRLRAVDGHVLDKHLHRFRRGKRTLEAACVHYRAVYPGMTHEGPHDAFSDALAACRLAWGFGRHGRVIRRARDPQEARELDALRVEWFEVRGDLDLLHAAQVRWAAEQAAGLALHFEGLAAERERAGDVENAGELREKAASVAPDWPLVPVADRAAA